MYLHHPVEYCSDELDPVPLVVSSCAPIIAVENLGQGDVCEVGGPERPVEGGKVQDTVLALLHTGGKAPVVVRDSGDPNRVPGPYLLHRLAGYVCI